MRTGRTAAEGDLASLGRDARAKGFGLVAGRAEALLKARPPRPGGGAS